MSFNSKLKMINEIEREIMRLIRIRPLRIEKLLMVKSFKAFRPLGKSSFVKVLFSFENPSIWEVTTTITS